MTSEFKDHLAKRQEKHEKQLEKRAEKRERKNKRIKKNLNYLKEKYGIESSDSSSEEERRKVNPYLSYLTEDTPGPSSITPAGSNSENTSSLAPSNPGSTPLLSSNENAVVCWVCRRSFTSNSLLQVHYQKSELHQTNLAKAEAEKAKADEAVAVVEELKPVEEVPVKKMGGFKNSFSQLPD